MLQALGRCTSSTQAGHNLNQFETFLHLHRSSHILIHFDHHNQLSSSSMDCIETVRTAPVATYSSAGPHFSDFPHSIFFLSFRSKLWAMTQHWRKPRQSCIYNTGKNSSGERNTVWMGWIDQPWSLKPDGIHICHCLLPAMASHGNCCPSDVVLGVDHAAKNQGASSHLAKSPAPAWIKAGAGPEIHEIPNLGDLEISWSYDDIWCHVDTSKSALCQQNDGDEDTGGTISGTSVIPPFDSFQHVILKGLSWLSGMFWLVLAA